ncbi:hypothetical protein BIY28_10925 [Brenneria goodwinii]|nr:hypothetical protein BIY28_10925 [Brenneria goodwinii]
MLPLALVGSVVGSLAIGLIAEFYLLIVMLAMTLYFFYKKILSLKGYAKKTKSSNLGSVLAGLMSGFMQGVGLGGGGSTRKAYFLSENFSLQQMNGTTSILSVAIGLVATITRLADKQVSIESLLPILYAIPVILLGNHYGKIVLSRINKRTTNVIIIFTFLFTIIALLYQLFNF